MIEAYKKFWTRAFDFKGHSNRGDYWWAYLIHLGLFILLAMISDFESEQDNPANALFGTYFILGIVPSLSITIRRLRDSGKSWQWYFIQLIPLIGGIWMIILLSQPSMPIT